MCASDSEHSWTFDTGQEDCFLLTYGLTTSHLKLLRLMCGKDVLRLNKRNSLSVLSEVAKPSPAPDPTKLNNTKNYSYFISASFQVLVFI